MRSSYTKAPTIPLQLTRKMNERGGTWGEARVPTLHAIEKFMYKTYSRFSVCAVFLNTWFLCIFSPTFSDSSNHDHTYVFTTEKKSWVQMDLCSSNLSWLRVNCIYHSLTILYSLSLLHCLLKTVPNVSLVLFLEAYSKGFHAPLPKKLCVPPIEWSSSSPFT